MVAVKAAQAASYLKALEPRIAAVLVFGPDAGLVSERAKEAASRLAARDKPPGEILRIEDADLDADPDRIYVELQTVAMFGGGKIVRTTSSRKVNAAFLKPLLEPGAMTGGLVVEAGNLRPDEALRKLFEASPLAAAIPCYGDETRDIDSVVRETMAAAGLEIGADARHLLVSRLGADRAMTRSELDKLVVYVGDAKVVTIDDIEAVVGDASELAIDAIVFAASGGNGRTAIVELDRAVSSGESAQMIILATQRHFQRLHRIRGMLEAGRSFDDAVRGLRPPLHFKVKQMMEAQTRTLDVARLDRALGVIGKAARDARLAGQLEATIAERMLLELSTITAARRR